MEFQIKLQNETLFRVFKFPDTKVFDRDRNCVRKQSISVTHVFTDAWNQARIRCKFKHSQDYDETQVFVISREYIHSMLSYFSCFKTMKIVHIILPNRVEHTIVYHYLADESKITSISRCGTETC